ncbi:MAG: methyltransferase [Treponema sp.]|nr:methyltransferase [Treponema sp.]
MTEGETVTARIQGIAAGGSGVARPGGKSVFVPLAAPGDLLRFRITKERGNWAEAEILEVLEPSPLRVTAPCALYGRCGGCSLQHLSYEAQIQAKTAILRDAFTRIGGVTPPEIRTRASQPFEYRNRFQFHAQPGGSGESACGFMERKSARLVALEDCPVAEAGLRKALKEGKIRPPEGKKRFAVYSRQATFLVEGETERGRVSILSKELAMDVKVFFQSNAAMLEPLIGDLTQAAADADKSLPLADIYCGVGTFAAFLGAEFAGVDLVEENKAALSLARENVRGNACAKKINCHALKDTAWVTTKAPALNRRKASWGFMVLDPPREGLSAPFAKWLAANGPELAAYVSCDPATLARDSRILLQGGYALKELTLYDFYPQTAHIESLALFSRRA